MQLKIIGFLILGPHMQPLAYQQVAVADAFASHNFKVVNSLNNSLTSPAMLMGNLAQGGHTIYKGAQILLAYLEAR